MTEGKGSFRLWSPTIRQNAMAAIRNAPDGYVVTIGPPTRTKDQNQKMWAMLSDVARAKPEGRQWPPETWKAAFMHYLGHQVLFAEGLDGSGPFPLGFRSSQLKVAQMIDLIECIYKYGDEHGVEWRETKRQGWLDDAPVPPVEAYAEAL
jgi:hypothetical protein